jgi:hypothetical protein
MATGLSSYLANKFLDAVANAVSYSAANVYIKLHTGEPGANATANAATETTRQEATFLKCCKRSNHIRCRRHLDKHCGF